VGLTSTPHLVPQS